MSSSQPNLPPGEPPPDPPRHEAELLDREAQLARDALQRLRGEILESLGRSADISAWAARYPWPTLGAAAVAGVGAGWALGNATRREPPSSEATPTADESAGAPQAAAPETAAAGAAPPAARLVGGLGTLAGAFASAVVGAATEAVAQVIKESLHDTLRPEDPGKQMPDDQSAPP